MDEITLSWATLTALVDNTKFANVFLTNLLFSNRVTQATRKLEIPVLEDERTMAPFTTYGGEAVPVEGTTEKFIHVMPPHIRVKRGVNPEQLVSRRRVGTTVFPSDQEVGAARAEYIGRELGSVGRKVDNTIEWMAAQILRGEMTWTDASEGSWTITLDKPSSHDVDLSGSQPWGAGSAIHPILHGHLAKQLMSEAHDIQPTDAFMYSDTAAAFLADTSIRTALDTQNTRIGELDLTTMFSPAGVIYLGRLGGIRYWEYPRTILNPLTGLSESLIRPKYVEYVSATPEAEMVMYHGAIADDRAFDETGGLGKMERFSKSWRTEDPSSTHYLVETNPLPYMRKPGAVVSIQVLA